MEYTTNYNLILQGRKPERVSLDSLNGNFTKIDMLLKEQSEEHKRHILDRDVHITSTEKNAWNTAAEQAILNQQTLGYKCKNLLKIKPNTATKNGITYTIAEDGTISLSGTATANMDIDVTLTDTPVGSYILSGCPEGGSTSTYFLRAYYTVEGNASYVMIGTDTSNTATIAVTDVVDKLIIRLRIVNGQTVDNLIFKPMLRDARISDASYVPYKESVEKRLTDVESAVSTARTEQTTWLGGGGNKAYTLPSSARIIEVIFADSGLSAFTYRKLMRYGNNLAVISESKVGTTFDFTQTVTDGVLTITASTSYGGTLAVIY